MVLDHLDGIRAQEDLFVVELFRQRVTEVVGADLPEGGREGGKEGGREGGREGGVSVRLILLCGHGGGGNKKGS
jgi:hypothetical protein